MTQVSHLLNSDEVLSAPESALMFQSTFTVQEFLDMIQSQVLEAEKLFLEGLDCSVLTPGQGWQKGKVKIRLEFSTDPNVSIANPPPSGDNSPVISVPSVANHSTPIPSVNSLDVTSFLEGREGQLGMWS
jgi:hypothetical protein